MRTLSLLVLAPFAALAIACGGGNSNDNPAVPTTDMSDAGSSMDTTMMDAAMPATTSTTDTSMAMDASMPSTDTSMAATPDASMDMPMDAGKAKKGKKKKAS